MDSHTLHHALKRYGHRWTLEILDALRIRPLRFTGLLQTIAPSPHPKCLSEALRRLQEQGLVLHCGDDDRSRYEITPAGRHLLPLIADFTANLRRWSASQSGSRQAPTTAGSTARP